MKVKKLTSEQEETFLADIKKDKKEFIHRLLRKLTGKNIRLKFSSELLNSLLLDRTEDGHNHYYSFIDDNELDISRSDLYSILKCLDLNNFEYHNLKVKQSTLKIFSDFNIILDLNELYEPYLTNLCLKSLVIKGELDKCLIFKTSIINCKNERGGMVEINPQRHRELSRCHFENVIFTDNFDDVDIERITLKNNVGVFINPQKVKRRSLEGALIDGATFTDVLDGCNIYGMKLSNVIGAKTKLGVNNYPNGSLSGVKVYITDDSGLNCFDFLVGLVYHRKHIFNGSVIVCPLKYHKIISQCVDAEYEIMDSHFDDDIDDVLGDSVPEKAGNNKVKQKTLF